MSKYLDLVAFPAALLVWVAVLSLFGIYSPPIEILGIALLGTAMILVRKQSIYGWCFSVAAGVLLVVYFLNIGLWGQVWLRVFTVLHALTSISFWRRGEGKMKKELRPSWLAPWQRALLVFCWGAIATVASFGSLKSVLDWVTMSGSIAGSLLLIKKKRETWYIWVVAEAIRFPLFVISGSYMNLFFSGFSLWNNVAAIRQWRKG